MYPLAPANYKLISQLNQRPIDRSIKWLIKQFKWMNEWMNERTNERSNEWTNLNGICLKTINSHGKEKRKKERKKEKEKKSKERRKKERKKGWFCTCFLPSSISGSWSCFPVLSVELDPSIDVVFVFSRAAVSTTISDSSMTASLPTPTSHNILLASLVMFPPPWTYQRYI